MHKIPTHKLICELLNRFNEVSIYEHKIFNAPNGGYTVEYNGEYNNFNYLDDAVNYMEKHYENA